MFVPLKEFLGMSNTIQESPLRGKCSTQMALLSNIILGWSGLHGKNTSAYLALSSVMKKNICTALTVGVNAILPFFFITDKIS